MSSNLEKKRILIFNKDSAKAGRVCACIESPEKQFFTLPDCINVDGNEIDIIAQSVATLREPWNQDTDFEHRCALNTLRYMEPVHVKAREALASVEKLLTEIKSPQ